MSFYFIKEIFNLEIYKIKLILLNITNFLLIYLEFK